MSGISDHDKDGPGFDGFIPRGVVNEFLALPRLFHRDGDQSRVTVYVDLEKEHAHPRRMLADRDFFHACTLVFSPQHPVKKGDDMGAEHLARHAHSTDESGIDDVVGPGAGKLVRQVVLVAASHDFDPRVDVSCLDRNEQVMTVFIEGGDNAGRTGNPRLLEDLFLGGVPVKIDQVLETMLDPLEPVGISVYNHARMIRGVELLNDVVAGLPRPANDSRA